MIDVSREPIVLSERHHYVVESISLHAPDGESIGTIRLYNCCDDSSQDFSIWIGEDDLSYFYVCLPTNDEDDDDELDVYDIEDIFEIPLCHYSKVSWI